MTTAHTDACSSGDVDLNVRKRILEDDMTAALKVVTYEESAVSRDIDNKAILCHEMSNIIDDTISKLSRLHALEGSWYQPKPKRPMNALHKVKACLSKRDITGATKGCESFLKKVGTIQAGKHGKPPSVEDSNSIRSALQAVEFALKFASFFRTSNERGALETVAKSDHDVIKRDALSPIESVSRAFCSCNKLAELLSTFINKAAARDQLLRDNANKLSPAKIGRSCLRIANQDIGKQDIHKALGLLEKASFEIDEIVNPGSGGRWSDTSGLIFTSGLTGGDMAELYRTKYRVQMLKDGLYDPPRTVALNVGTTSAALNFSQKLLRARNLEPLLCDWKLVHETIEVSIYKDLDKLGALNRPALRVETELYLRCFVTTMSQNHTVDFPAEISQISKNTPKSRSHQELLNAEGKSAPKRIQYSKTAKEIEILWQWWRFTELQIEKERVCPIIMMMCKEMLANSIKQLRKSTRGQPSGVAVLKCIEEGIDIMLRGYEGHTGFVLAEFQDELRRVSREGR